MEHLTQVQKLDLGLLYAKIGSSKTNNNNKMIEKTYHALTAGFTLPTPLLSPLSNISDSELFTLSKTYGKNALIWRRKFIGLLPEVDRRRLYERKGFSSIFVFAAKLASISEEQVRLTLNLAKRFDDKPVLKAALINGEISINKLSKIASVATTENQEFWAQQARLLPCRALETLIRDEKSFLIKDTFDAESTALLQSNIADFAEHHDGNAERSNGFFELKNDSKSLHVQMNPQENGRIVKTSSSNVLEKISELQLSETVKARLLDLQRKGIDISQLLTEFLDQREQEIEQEKEEIAKNLSRSKPAKSRYIQIKVRKIIHKEHGTKCSIPNCNKEATDLHHTMRFSLYRSHDPRYIAPLCHEHHLIAHSIDQNFHEMRNTSIRPTLPY